MREGGAAAAPGHERQDEHRRQEGADRAAGARRHEPGRQHDDGRREADRRVALAVAEREEAEAPAAPHGAQARQVLGREAEGERRRHQQVVREVAAVDVGPEDGPVPARPPDAVDPPRLGGDGLHEGDDRDRDADEDDGEHQPPPPGPLAQLAEDGEEEQREAGDEGEAAQRVGRADADRPPGPGRIEQHVGPVGVGAGADEAQQRQRQRHELQEDEAVQGQEQPAAGQRRHGTALLLRRVALATRRQRRRGRSRRAAG